MRVEIMGGKITSQANGSVVLILDLPAARLNSMDIGPIGLVKNWAELRNRSPVLQHFFQDELLLKVGDRRLSPTDVTVPVPAAGSGQAPLPKFISVKIVWEHVGLIHSAFASNDIEVRDNAKRMTIIQLVLEENIPWWRALSRSILIGFEHIVPFGLDHILFVLGIYLAARRFRDLLWLVTSFTLAHSITLGLTMTGVFIIGRFWEHFVEIGIAVSIAVVAFENCLWRDSPRWARILIVGGFGLIHGMGFAGRLSEIKWPGNTFYLALFGANFGIELGQLAVIGVVGLITAWWWHSSWYQSRIAVPASLLIGLYGLFAALDRIGQLPLPQKEILDFFWGVYDKYFFAVPVCMGAAFLLLLWTGYQLTRILGPCILTMLAEGKFENAKNSGNKSNLDPLKN